MTDFVHQKALKNTRRDVQLASKTVKPVHSHTTSNGDSETLKRDRGTRLTPTGDYSSKAGYGEDGRTP